MAPHSTTPSLSLSLTILVPLSIHIMYECIYSILFCIQDILVVYHNSNNHMMYRVKSTTPSNWQWEVYFFKLFAFLYFKHGCPAVLTVMTVQQPPHPIHFSVDTQVKSWLSITPHPHLWLSWKSCLSCRFSSILNASDTPASLKLYNLTPSCPTSQGAQAPTVPGYVA